MMVPILVTILCAIVSPSPVFIIQTQGGRYHQALARRTEELVVSQYAEYGLVPDILWSGRDLHSTASAWAVFPLSKTCTVHTSTNTVHTSWPGTQPWSGW